MGFRCDSKYHGMQRHDAKRSHRSLVLSHVPRVSGFNRRLLVCTRDTNMAASRSSTSGFLISLRHVGWLFLDRQLTALPLTTSHRLPAPRSSKLPRLGKR